MKLLTLMFEAAINVVADSQSRIFDTRHSARLGAAANRQCQNGQYCG